MRTKKPPANAAMGAEHRKVMDEPHEDEQPFPT
jgi:hypothetical protein